MTDQSKRMRVLRVSEPAHASAASSVSSPNEQNRWPESWSGSSSQSPAGRSAASGGENSASCNDCVEHRRGCAVGGRLTADDPDMPATTITTTAAALREARERAGVTRAQLAQLAGCSLTFLANVEQGAVPRRSPTLDRVREALEKASHRDLE
jgi:DNA-binding XRE family transcriptional regulator